MPFVHYLCALPHSFIDPLRQFPYKTTGLIFGMPFASILVKRKQEEAMDAERMKELVGVLMESSLYFELTLCERLDLIHRLLSPGR